MLITKNTGTNKLITPTTCSQIHIISNTYKISMLLTSIIRTHTLNTLIDILIGVGVIKQLNVNVCQDINVLTNVNRIFINRKVPSLERIYDIILMSC